MPDWRDTQRERRSSSGGERGGRGRDDTEHRAGITGLRRLLLEIATPTVFMFRRARFDARGKEPRIDHHPFREGMHTLWFQDVIKAVVFVMRPLPPCE